MLRGKDRLGQTETKSHNELTRILKAIIKDKDVEYYYSAVCSDFGNFSEKGTPKRGLARLFETAVRKQTKYEIHRVVKQLIMDQIKAAHQKTRKLNEADRKNLMTLAKDLWFPKRWKPIGERIIKRKLNE